MDELKKHEPLFGSWYADRLIGEGSFGKVYALKKIDFGKEYFSALKVITVPQSRSEISSLRSEGMDDQSIITHFKQFVADVVSEFELMAQFRGNSNIVSYEDHILIPHEDGFGYDIFIRMELLTSLVTVLEQKSFTKIDVIRLGIDICKALELCQKYNIIHRDIKPENIFVSKHGDYKLGDFGIARTVEKTVGEMSKKGTYTYMAPEVYKGEAYGTGVDLYSLGIVLYRLLNGNRTPFLPAYPAPITHSDRETALLRRMSGVKIQNPSNADGRLGEIVMKAIEYDPKDRFLSPRQMREEFEGILYTESERDIIYPAGDYVELPSNQYTDGKRVQNNTEKQLQPQIPIDTDKTSSTADKTVYTREDATVFDRTTVQPMAKIPAKKKSNLRFVFICTGIICALGLGVLGLKVMGILGTRTEETSKVDETSAELLSATADDVLVVSITVPDSTEFIESEPTQPAPPEPSTKIDDSMPETETTDSIAETSEQPTQPPKAPEPPTKTDEPTHAPETAHTTTKNSEQPTQLPEPTKPAVAPTYGISIIMADGRAFSSVAFTNQETGYATQETASFKVNNTGNQPTGVLTISLSGTNSNNFALSKTSINSIAAGGSDTFTVMPKKGLTAGQHNATVTVGGGANIAAKTFTVSFTVQEAKPQPTTPEPAKPSETYVVDRKHSIIVHGVTLTGLYTGDWKDGKPNGKGKITFDKNSFEFILYDGDWKNGYMDGSGIGSWGDGSKYTGGYKINDKTGQGTLTYSNGDVLAGEFKDDYIIKGTYTSAEYGIKYEGEFKKSSDDSVDFYGQGTLIFPDGDKYVGGFKDSLRSGQGTYTFANGDTHIGEYKNGAANGQGTYTFANGNKYVGEFKDDTFSGQGTFSYANGNKYVGEFKDDTFSGQGTFSYANDDIYIGEFKNGLADGQGTYTWADDGTTYVGEWKNDLKNGLGVETYLNGAKYEGQFKDGLLVAGNVTKVVFTFSTSQFTVNGSYTGEWKNDKPNGKGTLTISENKSNDGWAIGDTLTGTWTDGLINGYGEFVGGGNNAGFRYKGNYKNGLADGQGTMYLPDGELILGTWKEGEFVE